VTDHVDEYKDEYKIEVERDGRWWTIRIPDVGGLTQARRLGEVDFMARDYLALATHTPIERIVVHVVSIDIPDWGDINSKARQLVEERKSATEKLAEAQESVGQYARDLVALKVPIRDVAELLELSFQRVSQLVSPERT
jgi:hypothetical protein